MKLEIKKWGDSKIIVLPPHYIKYMKLEVGDYIDISDAVVHKDKERVTE